MYIKSWYQAKQYELLKKFRVFLHSLVPAEDQIEHGTKSVAVLVELTSITAHPRNGIEDMHLAPQWFKVVKHKQLLYKEY